jgi:hypothetical protein
MLLQGQNGGHRYPNGLTSKTFHNLVLEELSPWIKKDIGNGVTAEAHEIHGRSPV